MPVDTTVLLIEASSLPSSLEEQLTRRSVFVEHASQPQLSQVIPVVVPDLVLQSGKSQIAQTILELAQIENAPPLVVIADRATIRRLRDDGLTEISALIPQDLPVAAIAHRISTMARRSSQGEPLEHKTGAVPARPQLTTLHGVGGRTPSMGPPPPEETPPTTKRGSLAPQPLAAHQSVKIFDAEEEKQRAETAARQQHELAEAKRQSLKQEAIAKAEERRQQEQEARLRRALDAKARQEELKQKRAEETEARRQKEREARELRISQRPTASTGPVAAPHGVPLAPSVPPPAPAPAPSVPPPAPSVPPPAPQRPSSVPPPRPPNTPNLAGPSSYRPAPIVEHEDDDIPPASDDKRARRLTDDDELSVVAPLPVDIRLPLSGKSAERSTIRLALLDTDLTRADSVCAALRREGLEIFPVTPDVFTTRWPMLRRFAPQGLLVDEKSMVRGAAEWVETFRGDLFLRHVPVVLMRFSRLFRDNSGSVDLEPLLKLIEPLGKEEFALLQKLKPGRQVDLRSSQIPPFRLVQLLTEQDRNTRLDCQGGEERIVWPLGPGYAGKAKLLKTGSDKVLAKLSPEDAMSWLLSRDDCAIAVHEHTDPLAHPSQSQDSQVLLSEMTEAIGTPTRHQSVPPGPSNSVRGTSLPFPSRGSVPPTPKSQKTFLGTIEAIAKHGQVGSRLVLKRTQSAWQAYQESLTPLRAKVPEQVLFGLSIALPLLAAVVVVLSVIIHMSSNSSHSHPEPTRAASENLAADPTNTTPKNQEISAAAPLQAPGSSPSEASPVPDAQPSETDLWKVAPDSGMATCEEKLGPSAPTSQSPSRAIGYWKQARRLLMQGKSEEALEMMCLAGLFDPDGPAAEGLAEYYLAQRALAEAERWVKLSLKADEGRRKSHELLGDIESQKGRPKEALKIWLDTMHLSGNEQAKMQAIARKLMQDAALARRGGDLPRAERSLRRAAALAPESAVIAIELAEVFLQRETIPGAEKWATRARQLDANFSGAKILSGRIAEAAGKANDARDFYRSVPPGDPSYPQAQSRLSQVD